LGKHNTIKQFIRSTIIIEEFLQFENILPTKGWSCNKHRLHDKRIPDCYITVTNKST